MAFNLPDNVSNDDIDKYFGKSIEDYIADFLERYSKSTCIDVIQDIVGEEIVLETLVNEFEEEIVEYMRE